MDERDELPVRILHQRVDRRYHRAGPRRRADPAVAGEIGPTAAADPARNTVFSPVSIGYAFGMARAGAGRQTASQLDRVFGFPASAIGTCCLVSGLAQPQFVVRADRPFAFTIVHQPTGAPLFIGHVADPLAR